MTQAEIKKVWREVAQREMMEAYCEYVIALNLTEKGYKLFKPARNLKIAPPLGGHFHGEVK